MILKDDHNQSSLAIGQTVGVAPEADLYYIGGAGSGAQSIVLYSHDYAQAIRRILQIGVVYMKPYGQSTFLLTPKSQVITTWIWNVAGALVVTGIAAVAVFALRFVPAASRRMVDPVHLAAQPHVGQSAPRLDISLGDRRHTGHFASGAGGLIPVEPGLVVSGDHQRCHPVWREALGAPGDDGNRYAVCSFATSMA